MNLKLFCLLCFFSPELLIHFDILNKSKVLSKMSSNQPALMTTNTFKNVAKNYSQLALMSEQNILNVNTLGDLLKIKQFHEGKKNKNILKTKFSAQDKISSMQNILSKIQKKRSIQTPRNNHCFFVQESQILPLPNSQYLSHDANKNNAKYLSKQAPFDLGQDKNKLWVKSRKQSTNSNIQQYCSYQKMRFNSPQNKQKNQFLYKKFVNWQSRAYQSPCPQQVKALKKSSVIQLINEHTNYINLKQTVSTSPSKKNIRNTKISDFQLGRQLGKGKFGQVRIARHKKTGMLFSIKIINKQMIIKDKIIDQLIKQTKIQSFLNHSHIVKLYQVFHDDQNIYLLMELCCEGNLYDYMQKIGRIPEQQASQYMKQTCQAVSQLHYNKIIHRDIKPQNIVLCFGMVKICDFGWSTQIKGTMRQTFCGSPLYISPELLKGQLYDEKVDLWALGILGFEMMTGTIPFQIVTQRDLGKIITSRIIYPTWMSPHTKAFLQQLLQKNPQDRTSVEQLLQHPFLNRKNMK